MAQFLIILSDTITYPKIPTKNNPYKIQIHRIPLSKKEYGFFAPLTANNRFFRRERMDLLVEDSLGLRRRGDNNRSLASLLRVV